MKKSGHKFQEKLEMKMTFEEYFRDRCHEMVCLAGELERVLGREKALEIMGKAREKYMVELTRKGRRGVKFYPKPKPKPKKLAIYVSSPLSHGIANFILW